MFDRRRWFNSQLFRTSTSKAMSCQRWHICIYELIQPHQCRDGGDLIDGKSVADSVDTNWPRPVIFRNRSAVGHIFVTRAIHINADPIVRTRGSFGFSFAVRSVYTNTGGTQFLALVSNPSLQLLKVRFALRCRPLGALKRRGAAKRVKQ